MLKYRKYLPFNIVLIVSFAAILLIVFCFSCNTKTEPPTLQDQVADGKILAQKYCSSCHQLPSPQLIDRKSWVNGVLPAMGRRLKVNFFMGQYFCDKASVVNFSEWENIVTYYKTLAPDSLIIPKPAVAPLSDWANFKLEKPARYDKTMPSLTTLISFSPDHQLYTGDAAHNFYKWDEHLKSTLLHKFESPVTGVTYAKDNHTAIVTCIGVLAPVNLSKGKVLLLDLKSKAPAQPVLITDSLPRPVQTVTADFNKDGLTDYVTCGFGHDNGGLYLIEQQQDHSFKKIIVNSIAGGEQLITGDFNNDGWPDVMCLFAQADEGIRMFLNDQKGGFTTQTLLRFPSVYGSSSFQLVDFNHDGKPDILYTCGDNSDYSKVLKPYHGVYIFTNQGNWKFKQTYFYHIDGCTKAIASDFNHTGNLDIAVISFFADFKNHPQQGFTYFEQSKPAQFIAHEIPVNKYGRWLTMEVGDIDHDDFDDIVLGNFSAPGRGLLNQAGVKQDWDQNVPIIVLKNNGKKR